MERTRLHLIREEKSSDEVLTGIGRAAYKLRATGMSVFEIAEQLQLTEQVVKAGIELTLRAAADAMTDAAREDMLHMELDRLDKLQQALWPDAMQGSTRAVDSILKVMDQRHKLLGLEAKTEHTVQNAVVISTEGYLDALKAITDGEQR